MEIKMVTPEVVEVPQKTSVLKKVLVGLVIITLVIVGVYYIRGFQVKKQAPVPQITALDKSVVDLPSETVTGKLPKGILLEPDAVIVGSYQVNKEGKGTEYILRYESKKQPNEIFQDYIKYLANNSWKVQPRAINSASQVYLVANKDKEAVYISGGENSVSDKIIMDITFLAATQ